MQITFISTSFPLTPDSISGPFTYRLADSLAVKARLTVITPADNQNNKPYNRQAFKLVAFRYAPRRLQILAHQPGGMPAALRNRPWRYLLIPGFLVSMFFSTARSAWKSDIIHANWSVPGAIAGLAGLLTRTPTITTLRGSDVQRSEKSLIDRLFLKLCLATNKKVVTVSKGLLEQTCRLYPSARKKLVFIPNGVAERFLAIKRPDKADRPPIRLITIGSLIARKDIKTVIEAFAGLPDRHNCRLEIIGDGPERIKLEKLAATRGVGNRVSMTGAVPADKIPDKMANSDIFILASQDEGRPNVVLEAMASGMPVIATRIDGILELIEHEKTGLIFDVGDVDSLRQTITRLIDNPGERARLGQAGRQSIIQNGLTWDNCANRYLDIYTQITLNRQ